MSARLSLNTPSSAILLGLVLALPATSAGLLTPTVAFAQAPAFAQPVVELVPGGEITADGSSEVSLMFVAYEADGSPMRGLTGKISGDLGNAKVAELRAGVYQATLTPKAAKARSVAKVTLSGKTSAQTPVMRTFDVPVAPTAKANLLVTPGASELILGRQQSVSVSITLQGPDVDASDVEVRASSGQVTDVTAMGGGMFVAQYSPPPPARHFPQLALLTAVDKRNPQQTYGHAVLPLVGQVNFPVQGEANAKLIVQVGQQPFGPVQADERGMAKVPITVRPGGSQAKLISVVNGKRLEDPLDLKVPSSKRVTLFPVGSSVPADSSVAVPVRALVTLPDGKPDTQATVSFAAGSGTVSTASHEGNGIYAATWTPAFGSAPTRASIQVNVADAKGPQNDTIELQLVPGRANSLAVASEPPTLSSSTKNFKLFVKASGGPSGLSGRQLVIDAAGATQNGSPRDLGSGDYEVRFDASGNSNVDIAVGVASADTGNPVARVVVVPASGSVAADGRALQRVAVFTLDAYGYPVGNVPVQLQVIKGGGSLPSTLTTGPNGLAFASYTASSTAGYAVVQATGGGRIGSAGFLQAPAGVTALPMKVSGTAASTKEITAWRRSISQLSLTRDGGIAAAAPVVAVGVGGVPASLMLASDPAEVAPGGATTLKIKATDANGRPVEIKPADIMFLASAGSISPAQSVGGGNYQALLSIPADTTGQINIAASIKGTAVGAPIIAIPISGALASAWGAAPPAAAATPPAAEQPEKAAKPEKPPKQPRERKPSDTDRAWLRAGAGYLGGFYSYDHASQQQGGIIYDEPITVGYGETSAAGTFGFNLNGKVWLPFFEYVGAEASFRGSRWQIQLDEGFDEAIADGINALNVRAHGRYPLDVGPNRFSFGGFLGFHTSDFLYFTQEAPAEGETDPTVVYDQLWTVGNSYGIELGAEIGPAFFVNGLYEIGFTDYSAVFSDLIELELGYSVIDNMYIYGTAGRQNRFSKVYYEGNGSKEYVGDVADSLWMFGLGAGFQM